MVIPTSPNGAFTEGFDKYGEPTPGNLQTLLLMGEWNLFTTSGSTTLSLVAPLSGDGDGYGFRMNLSNSASSRAYLLQKLLGANYARVCGGITFKWNNVSTPQAWGVVYSDAGTHQFAICINPDGTFAMRRGDTDGTVLVTTLDAPSVGTTNCLEWDVAMLSTTTSLYTFYLNGVATSIVGGTGDICASATAQFSRVAFQCTHGGTAGGNTIMDVDHFYSYHYTNSGEAGASCLLGNPVIDTDYPNNDFDFTFDAVSGYLGDATRYGSSTASPAANSIILRKFTAVGDGTLTQINLSPNATSVTAKFKGLIFADDGTGLAAGALIGTGAEVVGCTSGVTLSSDMNDEAIVDGTIYWIGFKMDTSLSLNLRDANNSGYRCAHTYTNPSPNPCPALTISQGSWYLNGVIDPAEGWQQLRQNPPVTGSYNQGDTVGERFLHGFDPLTVTPLEIYCVAIKPNLRRTDAGARTVSVLIESDGTEAATPAVAPSTSGEWIAGYYFEDPDTSLPWDTGGVNQVHGGAEIIT